MKLRTNQKCNNIYFFVRCSFVIFLYTLVYANKSLILLTCQSGLESLVRRESEKLGLEKTTGQDRLVEWYGTIDTMMRLCMGSRFANRVYLNLWTTKVVDFDELFSIIANIRWNDYLNPWLPIIIDASSTRSILSECSNTSGVYDKRLYLTRSESEKMKVIKIMNSSGSDCRWCREDPPWCHWWSTPQERISNWTGWSTNQRNSRWQVSLLWVGGDIRNLCGIPAVDLELSQSKLWLMACTYRTRTWSWFYDGSPFLWVWHTTK